MKRLLRPIVAACLVLWAGCSAGQEKQNGVRPPAVAGQFYPSNPAHLKLAIEQFMKTAVPVGPEQPVALVVPHAGYIYCGQICADAYRQVAGRNYDIVVILGTNHTGRGLGGISIFTGEAYRTPLGDVLIDQEVAAKLLAEDKDCNKNREAHATEHSVEVQVPFVQTALPGVRMVAAVMSEPDVTVCTRFGQALAKVLRDRRPLIVASSDLSHYPAYRDAIDSDSQILEKIAALLPQDLHTAAAALVGKHTANLATAACGEAPIMAAMAAAKALGARHGIVLSYANSGDALIGDRSRVVGYGAVALTVGEGGPDTHVLKQASAPALYGPLVAADRKSLLAFARQSIARMLTTETLPMARGFSPTLNRAQGAFVTLKKRGDLRGCIGHIPPETPLAHTVGAMAAQAAFNDPRFPALTGSEFPEVEIEISVLTPIKEIRGAEDIQVGRDGVIISKDGRSAVFLPQVAVENKWGRDEMLDNLCVKAGLRPGSWRQGTRFAVFQAEVFSEAEYK